MARIFVSHARADDAWVDDVYSRLSEQGHEAFLDHGVCGGIAVGEAWEQRLYERLRWTTRIGQPLTDHTDAVYKVAFDPAGTTLATSSRDRTVILWDLRSVHNTGSGLVRRACARVGRGLSGQEWRRYVTDVTGIEYRETCTTRSEQ